MIKIINKTVSYVDVIQGQLTWDITYYISVNLNLK